MTTSPSSTPSASTTTHNISSTSTPYRISLVPRTFIPPLPVPDEQILWIGCSDNGWAETQTLDMPPEEFLVHRNPGCVVSNEDASTLSTVEWALRVSKVKHIVVCGHYGCRVVNCGRRDESMVEWLRDLEKLYDDHRHELEAAKDMRERNRRLVEMHVWAQAETLRGMLARKPAFADVMPEVHAFVYDASEEACVVLRS